MILNRHSREYMYFDLTNNIASDDIEISVNDGTTWTDLEFVSGVQWQILVCGPEAEDQADALLVAATVCPLVRMKDSPEVPVRTGDTIFLSED